MANPYFNAAYYLAQNPDVSAAGYTAATAESHYNAYGAVEGRAPAAWFNGAFYLAQNPDLQAAGYTLANVFAHFAQYGVHEGRSPSPNVALTTASLSAYAAANADLAKAFGITDPAYLTAQQKDALASHFYQYGYYESRPGNPVTEPVGGTFTLTNGVDTFGPSQSGANQTTAGNDTFNGTSATYTALDSIDGGAGVNKLVLADTAGTLDLSLATVKNIQSLELSSVAGLNAGKADVSAWAGLTSAKLDLRGVAVAQEITVADTTAVEVAAKVTAAAGLTVNGSSTTKATVNNTVDNVASTITILGGAATSAVTVAQTQATAAHAAKVTITDKNAADDSKADTITTVTLDGLTGGVAQINSDALATLNVANSNKNITIDNDTAKHALAVNLNNVTGGVISDVIATSVAVNATGKASSGTTLTANLATAISFAGDQTVSTALGAVQAPDLAITSTNTAGVTITTALDTDVTFTGGTGKDAVTIAGHAKSVNMGAGNDTVTASAALTTGGSVVGGEGTDTLIVNGASFALTGFTGFETLGLGALATGAYDATGFANLTVGAIAGNATFNNVAAGAGLEITATPTKTITYSLKDATGAADSLAITLKSAGAIDATTTSGVTAAGVESVSIANTDTDATAHTNLLTLVAADATKLTVTGNAALTLVNTGSAKIVDFDATGVTAGAVTFNSANATVGAAVSIKGGAGADILSGNAANDTIVGGAGDDQISSGTGLDILFGGAGNDTFTLSMNANGNTYATIMDFTVGDSISLANLDTKALANTTAVGAKITLAGTAAFADFLGAAAAGDGFTTAAQFTWFQYSGNTYAVVDNSLAASFVEGADQVIKLAGVVDLSTANLTASVLTLDAIA